MRRILLALTLGCLAVTGPAAADDDDDDLPQVVQTLPTGQRLTPEAARGAHLQNLNPGLADFPDFTAGSAISLTVGPDRRTALVLTSGFNKLADRTGKTIPGTANQYVFVFDLSTPIPRQTQALPIPNSFAGIAFAPDGTSFVVGGGSDDTVILFEETAGRWAQKGAALKLGHDKGLGLAMRPATAGLAVSADGATVVVANLENDSVSVVDLVHRQVSDIDLRPGKADPRQSGTPGGTYPFWVAIRGNQTAYVSSLRDRQVVEIDLATRRVTHRIPLAGNPNRMTLDAGGRRLFVAADNSDTVTIIDTASGAIQGEVITTAPAGLLADPQGYRGAAPDALALSADESRLYVANGGANAIAVIALDRPGLPVIGLIPVGWYPNDVAIAGDRLLVINGKSQPGPNPGHCSSGTPDLARQKACRAGNAYVLQLERASLLSMPIPGDADLEELTGRVAANNGYRLGQDPRDMAVMAELHRRIRHVIYVVKENRTYDQVLGDLGVGNGDPSLAEFGRALSPNHHALARSFVTLDNFYDSGEVSGDGWAWSTAARETDIAVKEMPVLYSGHGLSYDTEGSNRDINVALPTLAARRAANPDTPDDRDILPGTADVAAPDPARGDRQRGYLWDAALRAGLTVRNYGFLLDLHRYSAKSSAPIPLERDPSAQGLVVAFPANPTLAPLTDLYFRGFDNKFPDFWREREWEREFDGYGASGDLPALSLVRLMHDHFGDFGQAVDRIDTPERQMADNDYALGRLVDRVAHSPFRDSTLIFVIEDDAQDGPDHVDAHRSLALVAGPYVRHQAVVSRRATTVNVLRTIEDILGLEHLSLYDAYQRPLTEIFDLDQREWTFEAKPSRVLKGSDLPLPKSTTAAADAPLEPRHDGAWWAERTAGMDFSVEDKIDANAFNRLLWAGLVPDSPYPEARR
jgi:YVTN family beta-propeller protein